MSRGKLAKVSVIRHAFLHSVFCSLTSFESSAADRTIKMAECPHAPRQHMAVKQVTHMTCSKVALV